MGEFFRGWKRKIGCVTLLMALVAMVECVRTSSVPDFYTVDFGRNGDLWIVSHNNLASLSLQSLVGRRIRHVVVSNGNQGYKPSEYQWRWHGEGLGFRIGTGLLIQDRKDIDVSFNEKNITAEEFDVAMIDVTYWSIVIPMTLISAFLLLSKPRQSTQMKITEPISTEGA